MKEIKVTFWSMDPDNALLELWHTEPINGLVDHFGRDAYGEKLWFNLTEEDEKIAPMPSDVVFVICDDNFEEITRQSNDLTLHPDRFSSLYEVCRKLWEKIHQNFPDVTKVGFHDWLKQFAPDYMDSTFMSNWYDCDRRLLDTEILADFEYLGKKHHIIRHHFQHTKCEAVWYEYFASESHLVKSRPYKAFLGYQWKE